MKSSALIILNFDRAHRRVKGRKNTKKSKKEHVRSSGISVFAYWCQRVNVITIKTSARAFAIHVVKTLPNHQVGRLTLRVSMALAVCCDPVEITHHNLRSHLSCRIILARRKESWADRPVYNVQNQFTRGRGDACIAMHSHGATMHSPRHATPRRAARFDPFYQNSKRTFTRASPASS